METAFVAPRDEAERTLASLWKAALGIGEVGIHDNFFDLGGDSVIAIQIISKANKAGFRFGANDLFEHQTIAELAQRAEAPGDPAARGEDRQEEILRPEASPDEGSDGSAQEEFGWSQEELDEISEALKRTLPDE